MKRRNKKNVLGVPTLDQLEFELRRERYQHRYRATLRSTILVLISVAAIAVLIATLWMPVFKIHGSSMTPTLNNGNVVIAVKSSQLESGDIIAFYYNNKILVKRVIAEAGQQVELKRNGTVYVDNIELKEPYLEKAAFGDCDIEMPYQVPESRVFVMGDQREQSVDSRNTAIGCIAEEQIVGRLLFCIWPMSDFGKI
ncbi:MAG: signal peptidase I [Firmicutes bacterium]|nr:signal peptidase I [Bacillota bacterium]